MIKIDSDQAAGGKIEARAYIEVGRYHKVILLRREYETTSYDDAESKLASELVERLGAVLPLAFPDPVVEEVEDDTE